MDRSYTFRASAQFHKDDSSFIELDHAAPRTLHFSAPPEFGGEAGVWTPEDFLLAAIASCFVETFKAIARASKFAFQGIEVAVEGLVEKELGGLCFTRITLRPALIVYHESDRFSAESLLSKAMNVCLIGRSLSTQLELEAKLLVEEPVAS